MNNRIKQSLPFMSDYSRPQKLTIRWRQSTKSYITYSGRHILSEAWEPKAKNKVSDLERFFYIPELTTVSIIYKSGTTIKHRLTPTPKMY